MRIKGKCNREMGAVGIILIMMSVPILGVTYMQLTFAQPSDQQQSMNTMSGPEDSKLMDMKMNTTEDMEQTMMMQMINMMDKMNKMMDMMMIDMPMTSNTTDLMPMAGDNITGSMQDHRGGMMR